MSLNNLKVKVYENANGLCEYCKSPADISSQPFVIEHILPKSKRGKTTLNNLALSCQGCNNHKYNKISGFDELSASEVPIFNPRKHNWNKNFKWSNNISEIIGVTVKELKLNRIELQNLRELLSSVGKHPPVE